MDHNRSLPQSSLAQKLEMLGEPLQLPGMREVPAWLKSLRLHKYTPLLLKFSYSQMLALTDEQLEIMNVTQGARRKILHNIEKLKKRGDLLRAVQMNLVGPADKRCVRCAIGTIRHVLSTPIRRYCVQFNAADTYVENENLPDLILVVLNRVFSMVFGRDPVTDITNDYVLMMYAILDKITGNEEFNEGQQARVAQMRKQIRKRVSIQELRRFNLTLPPMGKCDSCQRQETVVNNFVSVLQRQQREQQDRLMHVLRVVRHQQLTERMMAQCTRMIQAECCPHQCMPRNNVHKSREMQRIFEPSVMLGEECVVSARVASYPQYQSADLHSKPSSSQQVQPSRIPTAQPPPPMPNFPIHPQTLNSTSQRLQSDSLQSLWPLDRPNESCESTSGYSSSSSERGSGAGSPRTTTTVNDGNLSLFFSSQMNLSSPLNSWFN